ncbi:hypothetical protein PHYSODRAFT_326935 [Phytophthora sojae]|uniref:Prolyl 4-hydroxylase alpha subunit Fe(2+) 2OG dioxygenase domain-containing protein n=1 Tax=Phytophthora sojae (strain P6497) TaxID=1094619 RepID=G4YUR2_PHYSP|nr:hypothetical protein PHYSODRAFT_326935 [Phytophthora sojae]EGZ25987.1 hypothetical protein PHYSODRAFT_326935 [Phytophthora sojae]|eukprot:XP_009521275.1 hypothetical protein PHYSODRAFT_326935 [Phytophthora sojae]
MHFANFNDNVAPQEGPGDDEAFGEGEWPFGGHGEPDDYAGEYSFGGPADALPPVPGLFIDGVGTLSVPLSNAQAEELVAQCEKSPFGRRLDTLMDESVRKSWQLPPDQITFQNPQWQAGVEELSEIIAGRFGYKGVPMQCKLYKLLVYGEGGHFVKHQDTEKEDGMVATLVSDGMAAFVPYYAVHYADAEHALEKEQRPILERRYGGIIGSMGNENEDSSFALMLSHEYTERSIEGLGARGLKSVDRARFRALRQANAVAAQDKKLEFAIGKLAFTAF